MRKIVVFLSVLAILGLMMGAAQANEIRNPDFTGGTTVPWVNPSDGDHKTMLVITVGGAYGKVAGTNVAGDEAAMTQVLDDKYFWGTTNVRPTWSDAGTQKQWTLSADVNMSGHGYGEMYLYYYAVNQLTAPTIDNIDHPTDSNWIQVLDGESTGYIDTTVGWDSATFTGTITTFQPRWFAVGLEAGVTGHTGVAYFDNVDVTGVCIPVPPAVWLFGSGLLGLVGWRRFKA